MDQKAIPISILEEKIVSLLNKLKENHLSLTNYRQSEISLQQDNKSLNEKILLLKEENKSLKIANNLLGGKEGKIQAKTKINRLIREVDYCIQHLSEIN